MKPEGRFLSKISTLEVIRRENYHNLMSSISLMTQLTSLDINFNDDINMEEYISVLKQLKCLNVSGCTISVEGIKYISELKELTCLNVYNCNIHDEGVKYIRNLKQLTNLQISYNNIGSKGVEYITDLDKLTKLNIDRNNIGNKGAELIGSTMKQLKYLDIRYNQIDSNAAACLQNALPKTVVLFS